MPCVIFDSEDDKTSRRRNVLRGALSEDVLENVLNYVRLRLHRCETCCLSKKRAAQVLDFRKTVYICRRCYSRRDVRRFLRSFMSSFEIVADSKYLSY